MAEQDLDRSHQATPHKLERAKERGQVPKSRDIVSVVVFTAAMAYLAWQGLPAWREQFAFDQALLLQAARIDASPHALWQLVERMISVSLWMGLPFFATLVIAAVVGNIAQTGPVFSADPLKIDFNRLNPSEGLKRFFSMQVLFNALRTALKLVLLSVAVWIVLKGLAGQFYYLASLSAAGFLRVLLDDFATLGLKLAIVLWLIALLDLAFTRRQFAQKMRMSHKEIKDEVKQREGDPRVRSRLRDLRREIRKRSMALRNTRHADVLITNPTHVAVALRYEHGRMAAPELIAKGAGVLAAAMRQIAARHNIPVVQNPPLARKLFHDIDVERPVPGEFFADVARIIVWVMAMKQARERPAGGTA
ncbi:MAG TPA: EscU/YscU/HrcU family type III secretion system export apparatus switch protein [Ramlibacter sp.]|nr:EscU/YscU/HrcU family type III secretion system export apparatus switch protein [Ramlibacter sp.]